MPTPRGEYCPFEGDRFASEQFRVVDGTRIHDVRPPHRASDGLPVELIDDQGIIRINVSAFEVAEDIEDMEEE
jgi:hypothetical protein